MSNAETKDVIGELQEGFSQLSSAIVAALEPSVATGRNSFTMIKGSSVNLFCLERQDQAIQEILRTNSKLDALLLKVHSIPEGERLQHDIQGMTTNIAGAIKRREERIAGLRGRLSDLTLLLADVDGCSATLQHRKADMARVSDAKDGCQQ